MQKTLSAAFVSLLLPAIAGCGGSSATANGTSSAPAVMLSAATLTFSTMLAGASSSQSLTLTNSGSSAVAINGITLTGTNAGSFSETNNCAAQLAASTSCSVSVTFSPAAAGNYAATLNIADNAAGSPQTVALAGTATAPAPAALSFTPASLTFTQAAESSSAPQTVTLTNAGGTPLTLNQVGLSGANAANFSTSANTCGSALAAGASCSLAVVFTPSLSASFSAGLTVASSASNSPQTLPITGTGTGTLSIDTSKANDWVISNGAITLDWNSTSGHVFGVHLANSTDNLVDATTTSGGQPDGLYMDNVGNGAGTITSGYQQTASYIDWWISTASSASNAFTVTQHFVVSANDPGFHVYSTVGHSASDIAGSIGQWQYVFRISLPLFTETYSVNSGLGNLGVIDTPLPAPSVSGTTDPGRQVQNAAVDLHGLALPSGFTREFYTKYDYSSHEYLHREHGVYGSKYGAWLLVPRSETLVGGPTKQDLVFTDNILMMEALSSHLDNALGYTPAQGVATNRLFGPYYFHFNTFTTANNTPAALYAEAATYEPFFDLLYDADTTLTASGYTPSTARGTVSPGISGGGSATANAAWTVLSDPGVNFQYSSKGNQYWVNDNAAGNAVLSGVVPGTYRLSSYVLGQWGELRQDGVTVTANGTTSLPNLTFTPENFGTATPVWTIGTPDRSAHEFLHGHDANGNDLRNYYGAYNYWADFASTNGQQVYYATAVGSTPATNDPVKINYVQWQSFNPGLYAGVYNSADDTTDGYKYILPSYVSSVTATIPATTIHFTTTSSQQAQGQYAVLSVGLASVEGSLTATLNGHPLTWHVINASDAGVRSGLSGYYQWVAYQWDTSQLNAPGADNVLTFSVSQTQGVQFDALRFEITGTSASPSVTGWNDYEWLYKSQYVAANDAVANNGK